MALRRLIGIGLAALLFCSALWFAAQTTIDNWQMFSGRTLIACGFMGEVQCPRVGF